MTINTPDPVENGIKEWQKVKAAAEEALARASKAEEEAAFLRGQNVLLQEQCEQSGERLRNMQQRYDELGLMCGALGTAVLEIIDKHKLGGFRRAGSIETTGEEVTEIETGVRDLIRQNRLKPKIQAARQ